MIVVKSLSDWVDKVKDVNKKATYRALNKAASKTNTQFKRLLQKDLGIKSKDISKRIYQRKATSASLRAHVSLATKHGIPLHYFKPKVKVVKVKPSNRKKARKYNGVSISIPAEGARFIVPKAFMATMSNNNKTLVMARKGNARLPVDNLKRDVSAIALKHQGTLNKFMQIDFKKQFSAQLKLLSK